MIAQAKNKFSLKLHASAFTWHLTQAKSCAYGLWNILV